MATIKEADDAESKFIDAIHQCSGQSGVAGLAQLLGLVCLLMSNTGFNRAAVHLGVMALSIGTAKEPE